MLTDRGRRGLFSVRLTLRALASPVAFGVAGAVFDANERVLLVKQTYMRGWRFPGGGVGHGEPPDEAVLRELKEEVGLSGGVPALLGIYTAKAGPASHVVAFYRVDGGTVSFKPNLEVCEIMFADPAAPPDDTAPVALRRLKELCGAPKAKYW